MRLIYLFLSVVPIVSGCPSDEAPGDTSARHTTADEQGKTSSRPPPEEIGRDERMKRAEAVRRASEELYTRGVKTEGYLINLIVEGDRYKVAFVKHARGKLRRQLLVEMKRDDFDIIAVNGVEDVAHDAGPGE